MQCLVEIYWGNSRAKEGLGICSYICMVARSYEIIGIDDMNVVYNIYTNEFPEMEN